MKLLLAGAEMMKALVDILNCHNYVVDTVDNGIDALEHARTGDHDGIILDIMMPKMDGLTVLETIRKEGSRTPVLLLTVKGEVESRIRGLDLGADDCLSRPFVMEELLARIRAMLRRRVEYTPDLLICGDLSLDRRSCELKGPEGTAVLSRLEFRLMEQLILNQGGCLATEVILEKVWGGGSGTEVGAVWVYISYLRKKLQAVSSTAAIRAKRGVGYMLEPGA